MALTLDRKRWAVWCAKCALSGATALVLLPKGMTLFALLLILVTCLAPDRLIAAWPECRPVLRWIVLMVLLLLGLTIVSMYYAGQGWREVDNPSRFLWMPWCALMAYAMGVSRRYLWLGALVGVGVAFAIALGDASAGIERAAGGRNPIVFANAVLALLVVAVYCRPTSGGAKVFLPLGLTLLLGVAAIVLSGSRGALPGFALMMLVAVIGHDPAKVRMRLGMTLGGLSAAFLMMWSIPWLAAQSRLESIQVDLQHYADGNVDSPIGARLEFLTLAWRAFVEHPWMGIGLDRFGLMVRRLPECSQHLGVCQLEHAHNDVAQWAATMGVPGLLMIIGLYLLPFLLFLRMIRKGARRTPVGAAWTGLMLVSVYFLSGMTQSMFAHALTTTVYVVLVGLLLGLGMREARQPPAAP